MILDCVFLGPGPVSIAQTVNIENHVAESVQLTVTAEISIDGRTFIHSTDLVMPPHSGMKRNVDFIEHFQLLHNFGMYLLVVLSA